MRKVVPNYYNVPSQEMAFLLEPLLPQLMMPTLR